MQKVKVEPATIFQLKQNRPLTNCLATMTSSPILFLLSADSQDILIYTRQPLKARKPVKAARGKAALETQMILNHKTAIEQLVENIENAMLNRYTLVNLHSSLAENLLPNPADEGREPQLLCNHS